MAEALPIGAIRWESAGPLLLLSLAIMGSPGPATVSLVAAGSAYGVRRSLPYLVGIIVGTALVLVAVATGITAALLAVPAAATAMAWLAAAYVLWLAWTIAAAPPLSDATAAPRALSFAGGTILGVANPKAWVAIAAVFASARLAAAAGPDAAAKVALLSGMIVVICMTWLVAGMSIAPLLRHPCRARAVNVALAVSVVAATALAVLR